MFDFICNFYSKKATHTAVAEEAKVPTCTPAAAQDVTHTDIKAAKVPLNK